MLPDHIMRELRYIELNTNKRIRTLRVGTFTSRLRGSGFDFDQHQIYREGDDVRRIDWNVTARMNAPYVRETHADRELNVVVALDLSKSMQFGTGGHSKKEMMLFVAACLVFSAVADQVNTGFLAFSDRVLAYRAPKRARARAWTMLEEIWALEPQGRDTKILPVAQFLSRQLKAVTIVFIVSDFMTGEDFGSARELKALAVRHDVVGVVLEDPAEMALLPGTGAVKVRDLETGRETRIGLSDDLRYRYDEMIQQRRKELIRTFYRTPMDHVFLRSGQDVIEPLLRLFAARRHA
jgi:uncharacterized protein (DUF58 family)